MIFHGLKVFVICPETTQREKLIDFLRRNEFLAFGINSWKDEDIKIYTDSIIFTDLDSVDADELAAMKNSLKEKEIKCVLAGFGSKADYGETASDFKIIIDTSENGFFETMLDFLNRNHAQGQRHYIRFGGTNASIATFVFHWKGKRYAGIIHDISAAGISCEFKPDPGELDDNNVKKLIINLPGREIEVSGRFSGTRDFSGRKIHIFLFSEDTMEKVNREIHDFIFSSLKIKYLIK